MIAETLKAAKEKKKGIKKDETIFATGYYSLGGALSGFAFVWAWEHLHIPELDKKIDKALITHEPLKNSNHITVDKTAALMISTILMMSELLGIKGGMASGSGFLLGYTAATQLRKGKYVGQS
jgi:hypothetical protein